MEFFFELDVEIVNNCKREENNGCCLCIWD